jgi:hypothetical protein
MAISLDITRKLPIGVQSFEDLRKKDCCGVTAFYQKRLQMK